MTWFDEVSTEYLRSSQELEAARATLLATGKTVLSELQRELGSEAQRAGFPPLKQKPYVPEQSLETYAWLTLREKSPEAGVSVAIAHADYFATSKPVEKPGIYIYAWFSHPGFTDTFCEDLKKHLDNSADVFVGKSLYVSRALVPGENFSEVDAKASCAATVADFGRALQFMEQRSLFSAKKPRAK